MKRTRRTSGGRHRLPSRRRSRTRMWPLPTRRSYWVETKHAWYRLTNPRPTYASEFTASVLDYELARHLAIAIRRQHETTYADLVSEYCATLPPYLEHYGVALQMDAVGDDLLHRPGLESLWTWLPDLHQVKHAIMAEARAVARAAGLENDAASRQRRAPAAAALAATRTRNIVMAPPAATPAVMRAVHEDREFAVFPGVATLGEDTQFPVPSSVRSIGGDAGLVISAGNVVELRGGGSRYIVHFVTKDRASAHLLKLVKTKDTFIGAFGRDDVWVLVGECVHEAIVDIQKVDNDEVQVLERFFTAAQYELYVPGSGGACPSCNAGADVTTCPLTAELDPRILASDPIALLKGDPDLLRAAFPSLPTERIPQVWVPKLATRLFQGDYVYFIPPGAHKVGSSKQRLTSNLRGDQGVYSIGEIRAISSNAVGTHILKLRLMGRWDALRRPRGTPTHERRLFDTKVVVSVPVAEIKGTVAVVPLEFAGKDYFHVASNFVSVGALHPTHDPRLATFAHAWCQRPPKARHYSRRALKFYRTSCAQPQINRSASVLAVLNDQLQALLFASTPTNDANDVNDDDDGIPKSIRRLPAVDLFSGCGGLTVGFDRDRFATAETKWAIEFNHAAADIFALNFPQATVAEADANAFLRAMVDPSTACKNLPAGFDASQLPKRGDVGMLYCGPPCQGFSGMNQNRTNEDHKNALILTALSYVEVLRPAVFLLENVTGMLGFRLGAVRRAKGKVETGGYTMGVPRLIVRVLLDLGYQVGWSVLQVGAFGSCQSRRRVIFVATLPHVKLPVFPEPMYLFRTDSVKMATYDPALRSADDESVDIESDQDPLSATPAHWRHDQEPNQGWNSPMTFVSSRWALFPPRFISDAISDFPGFDFKYPADNEAIMQLTPAEKEALRYDSSLPVVDAVKFQKSQIRTIRPEKPEERKYLSLPKTEFQWQMRRNNRTHRGDWDALVSHPWYSISADVDGGHVEEEGEVPDFVCRSFKAVTVERIHHIARDARSHHRDHRDLPELLKPWALDVTKNATAAKHGGWKGLYGRMDWWGFSRTATTETDPMCKTGTILHPEQNRTVTVREMARIQTFPDDFVFDTDKIMVAEAYRQVGNAVPPALATAINRELFKSLRASPLGHLSEAKAREAMGVPPLDDPRT